MTEYRDYGTIHGWNEYKVPVDTDIKTQVYKITHDGAGLYLPYMVRSFVSFSYGGKNIEDFNLLAIIENNALQRKLYADFNDNVVESNIYDGQMYWSTHYSANSLDFTLFTDGITENQLDAFKTWFRAGRIEELILSEHPNRAILARVSTPPEFSMLPFEKEINMKVLGEEYKTSTTYYKGRINISFVMDEPFWYSVVNILDKDNGDGFNVGYWIDSNYNSSLILKDKDALKLIAEDGVPFCQMLYDTSSTSIEPSTILIGTEIPISINLISRVGMSIPLRIVTSLDESNFPETIMPNMTTGTPFHFIKDETKKIQLPNPSVINIETEENLINSSGYFYYAGTAPCYPLLTFRLIPEINNINNPNKYISMPNNTFYSPASKQPYNTIVIQSTKKKYLKFTTPSIYTGYNQVLYIFNNILSNSTVDVYSWEEIRERLRENVKHWAPRNYAMRCIDAEIKALEPEQTEPLVTSDAIERIIAAMQNFLKDIDNNLFLDSTYIIDCKSGRARAQISFRVKSPDDFSDSVVTIEENVGDMILSNLLKIEERNILTEDGYISKWTPEHPEYTHVIYSDAVLSNVNLQYRYMYF